eukprot:CAMPEP_0182903400 /NCGR_PEP_ID=MMETSP0034_2-20130328/31250_1 /TAXON_ID=156128 /ORGANISM="Nephroselmis pyriformis, Strain CCMP717" /LENGTH=45 /DNA_ID= /DNA_START= /DNA_END= /DNA_ORIENTATION=
MNVQMNTCAPQRLSPHRGIPGDRLVDIEPSRSIRDKLLILCSPPG